MYLFMYFIRLIFTLGDQLIEECDVYICANREPGWICGTVHTSMQASSMNFFFDVNTRPGPELWELSVHNINNC